MTQTPSCAGADALQASSSSHLVHDDADQTGVIERVEGGLGSAAPALDRALEGSMSLHADRDGLMREQGSTAWFDSIEHINAGMLLASHHVPKQTNGILMEPLSALQLSWS